MKQKLTTILLWCCLVLPGAMLLGGASNNGSAPAVKEVKTIGEAELERLLTSQKGNVLFVNVWASWCKPCREEFPDLLKLQNHYRGKNVRIISISADYPEDVKNKVLPFLAKFDVKFPVYVQAFKKQEEFIDRMNKKWNGALPATFIYDKKGTQRLYILGKKDYEYFRGQIEKLR